MYQKCMSTDPNVLCRSIECKRCKAIRLEMGIIETKTNCSNCEAQRKLMQIKNMFKKVDEITKQGDYVFVSKSGGETFLNYIPWDEVWDPDPWMEQYNVLGPFDVAELLEILRDETNRLK